MNDSITYSIKQISKITGLSPILIRAWENRYRIVSPTRSKTNRRIYTHNDLLKLKLASAAVRNGFKISQVANLSIEDLESQIAIIEKENEKSSANEIAINDSENAYTDTQTHELHIQLIKSIIELDSSTFKQLLFNSSAIFSLPDLIQKIISPLIVTIGDLWQSGKLRISHEHFASAILSSFLKEMRGKIRLPENAAKVIVCTPLNQRHELGALSASLLIESFGWRVIYLSYDIPAEEIAAALLQSEAKAIALSIIYPTGDHYLINDLLKLLDITNEIPILIGGAAAFSYKNISDNPRLVYISDYQTLIQELGDLLSK